MPTVFNNSDVSLSFLPQLRKYSHENEANNTSAGSDLLKAIRAALDRTCAEERVYHAAHYEARGSSNDAVLEELTWDSERVVISYGGVIHRQWSFAHEGQPVQWACKGWLEMAGTLPSSRGTSHYTSEIHAGPSQLQDSFQPSIFGPFKRAEQQRTREAESESRARAMFVFLRSIGKVYLENGLEYTFNLPFIVRRAWPLHPYGVMVQRSLEEAELQEADLLGDDALIPTIFSLMSPLSEATVVGVTSRISTGPDNGPAIPKADEDEAKLLPAKEVIICVTPRTRFEDDDIVVTVHPEHRRLSIWRYAYIKPKDTPFVLSPPQPRKSRHSTAPVHGRRSSLGGGERDPPANINDHPLEAPPAVANTRSRPMPALSSLPGMAPSLSASTTMANLAGVQPQPEAPEGSLMGHARRDSLGRTDLTVGIDRIALGGSVDDPPPPPREHTKMRATHWVSLLHSFEISKEDALDSDSIQTGSFDHRFDGQILRTLFAVCLPRSKTLKIFTVFTTPEKVVVAQPIADYLATSAAAMRITRENIKDLLYTSIDGSLHILSQGQHNIPLHFDGRHIRVAKPASPDSMVVDTDMQGDQSTRPVTIASSDHGLPFVVLRSGSRELSTWLDYVPKDLLTLQCLQILALALPAEEYAALHTTFLREWEKRELSADDHVTFESFVAALSDVFEIPPPQNPKAEPGGSSWSQLTASSSRPRFAEDIILKGLQLPAALSGGMPQPPSKRPNIYLAPILCALHTLGEDLRLMVHRLAELLQLVKLICQIAVIIRPEWVDYWKRLCPDAIVGWVPSGRDMLFVDDRLTVWPPDYNAVLYGRISNPDWKLPWYDTNRLASQFRITPSFAYGRLEPLGYLRSLTTVYRALADKSVDDSRKRAENAMLLMVKMRIGPEYLSKLQMGVAAPLREVARTCQLAPGHDWPAAAYEFIGRNDLSEGISMHGDAEPMSGYRTIKDFLGSLRRRTIFSIVSEACGLAVNEISAGTGVELNLDDFTQIRFGQDKRLEEVARMLRSSCVPVVKIFERPELSELDMAKEQQAAVLKVAERTLALPIGRAMFTFGTVPTVTREANSIPKMEYAVQLQPANLTMLPEAGKIPQESLSWGEFHNGVAAALRISPSASSIDSSWIKFNKPSELTPEHAGFLYGLGLTGHLKEMVTWHTFSYLTPKHELTSIGVLLGLSAANVGSCNRHVTKLLAVHTPALLPTPNIDLNVPLVTQAAGLVGIGLLFMGTKHRRMAEVCLKQISRSDLVQPDVSNEHREAYTTAAALAFGMVMLGKGSSPAIPADEALVAELRLLIHGDLSNPLPSKRSKPNFDFNLTSPAATIALGMMYMKTNSQEMVDALTIPDTVLSLNRIPPSFLLLRTLARGLIMWGTITPTQEWVTSQLPSSISVAMNDFFHNRHPVDDALELAYYNIVSAACFVLALKYAGTAREEPYLLLITYYDMFSRLAYTNGPAYDHKIKRHAIRDGLNLISIALNMVMAGTGEINCMRRLRYSYGIYNQMVRYGTHVATHMSLGLLFLGGGRFTLGNSDAAVACMIAAFFPRFAQVSFDNKSYLQALRHLWVLAVEPRCLVARDVDTKEIVYLPVKIKVQDGSGLGAAQLISPTLVPDFDKLMSIRIDTPRYWPFYLDLQNVPRHKEALLQTQTIFVKRRTAFLSYLEDPKGSRSLFVRSGSSTGEAATLDFPRLTDTKPHAASDLTQFISSFANDPMFLAFADHFCREEGFTEAEKLFHAYCHASLLDAILQDKPLTLQSHIVLYFYRNMVHPSQYFNLRLHDVRFTADFYGKVFERRFSGRQEGNPRAPLIREATLSGALQALDTRLDHVHQNPEFLQVLGKYSRGELSTELLSSEWAHQLSWYLLRNSVPVSTLLIVLRELAQHAYESSLKMPPPEGASNAEALERGIRAVLHATGTGMTTALGAGWSTRSLEEVVGTWRLGHGRES